jgi:hypothetical protein
MSVCIRLTAQSLPVARNYQDAYDKQTRSTDGRPGKNYWQNTATYNIDVGFTPATRIISGREEIIYTNNSPDSLQEIWFKLYPNLYKKGSQRDQLIDTADVNDGVHIENIAINGVVQTQDAIHISGTNMYVDISALSSGKQLKFNIAFFYQLNRTSHIRTGMIDDRSAFIAYFFPRIAVYDDIDGWNEIPYTGTPEMYNDFCSFNVNITVPKIILFVQQEIY